MDTTDNETPSNERPLRFYTGDEVIKIIVLILGWYIAIFHGVLSQVFNAEPTVRAVIGILLMALMSTSIPNRLLKREKDYQDIIYWIETVIMILTMLFGIIMFGASMEEMGYPMGSP